MRREFVMTLESSQQPLMEVEVQRSTKEEVVLTDVAGTIVKLHSSEMGFRLGKILWPWH